MPQNEQTEGPGMYVYDPRQHRRKAEEDALGTITPASTGRTYLDRDEELQIELRDGTIMRIRMTSGGAGIIIRNDGRSRTSSLAVVPNCSNVIEVYPR